MSSNEIIPGGGSSNASVGTVTTTAPASAGEMGFVDGGGLLQPVTGTVANGPKVNVSASALPTGAATETTLAAASAKLPATLGQKAMSASMAVAVASDQSALPVTAAALPLPAGAATETTLAAASAKLPATLGQKAMSASMAVAIASDQSALPISAVALPLPAGAATSANQTSELTQLGIVTETVPANDTASSGLNGRLQRIAQRLSSLILQIPAALGQTTKAASLSVALASDQGALATLQPVNANAAQTTGNVSTVITLTKPANAVGFLLQASDANGANFRWAISATASATVGQQLQPGRDTGFIPCAKDISICSESGTNEYEVLWILSV